MNSLPLAPTGRTKLAQGNARGLIFKADKALKGRPNGTKFSTPLQGLCSATSRLRALPWAGLGRPVGAHEAFAELSYRLAQAI